MHDNLNEWPFAPDREAAARQMRETAEIRSTRPERESPDAMLRRAISRQMREIFGQGSRPSPTAPTAPTAPSEDQPNG